MSIDISFIYFQNNLVDLPLWQYVITARFRKRCRIVPVLLKRGIDIYKNMLAHNRIPVVGKVLKVKIS